MKNKFLIVITLCIIMLLSFCFVGCGDGIKEGEVYEKEFKKKVTTTTIIPVSIYNGTTTIVTLIPIVMHYPDRWAIRIRNFSEEKDEFFYNEFYVTEECYNSTNIGDWFVYDENYCYDSEPCKKEKA